MQIIGFIATPLEPKTADGRAFRQFRLATSHGRGEARKTTWFTVQAAIDELEADMLGKGQRVQITGALKLRPYLTREGKPGVDAVLETEQVELAPGKSPSETAPALNDKPADSVTTAATASTGAPKPAAAPAPAPAPTPAATTRQVPATSHEDEELPF